MSETVLNANPGRATGSSTSRRLRREGRIPAVVYGHGMDPLAVDIDRRELRAALSGAATLAFATGVSFAEREGIRYSNNINRIIPRDIVIL